jgi:DNA mismatch repair protein MutS2
LHPPLRPLRADPCPPKTRSDLEWDRVLSAIAERCAGVPGRDLAARLPFAETREEARRFWAEASEAKRTLDEGRPLPVGELGTVHEAIERTRVGGVLGSAELRAVAHLLQVARSLRRFLSSRKAELPALFDACATDPTLDDVADRITQCFEPDGTLADGASPRLGELRGEWHAARKRMLARMEDLMGRHEAVLQDRFVTEREGRWVLPVRSDAHERFPGIVHATSSSGATLFVEPRAVVPMGNRLKVLEADVKREEDAVYAGLTAELAHVLPSVEAAEQALALADVRGATARLAVDLDLTFPELVDEPRLDLKKARHPLLALDYFGVSLRTSTHASARAPAARVVPSDLFIEAGRAVVVSGPNAGGKTVALKAMGLSALMVRSGVPVACAVDSVLGLFDVVLTDVGDDQSLQKNLSTFSAHVSNLAAVLGETTRGALVLLDELAGGTDPREGEALAAGVLDSLCARGGAVLATTHYEGLKILALVDARFENASVGFALATMTPTFELAMGAVGSSSALAVARRFGMPSTVIERAERFLAREDHDFETVVKKLNDERAALALARAAAEDREREAAAALSRLSDAIDDAKNRQRIAISEQARDLLDHLKRAREDLRDAQAKLRTIRTNRFDPEARDQSVRDAERAIERVTGEVAVGGPLGALGNDVDGGERAMLRPALLRKGTRVWVARLRAEADVLEVLADGNVRLAAGPLKLTVPACDLRAAYTADARLPMRERPAKGAKGADAPAADPLIQVRDNTCDVRGLRVDDGVAMATTFLDRALGDGQSVVFLLHGHGTGALRDALRKELTHSPYVARFRGGDPERGGEGVTIVWLQ